MEDKKFFNDEDITELEKTINYFEEEKTKAFSTEKESEQQEKEKKEEKELEEVEINIKSIFEKISNKNLILEKIFMFLTLILTLNIFHIIFSIFKIKFSIFNLTRNLNSFKNIFEGIENIDITSISKFTKPFKTLNLSLNSLKFLFILTFLFLVYFIVSYGLKKETKSILKGQFVTGMLGSLVLFLATIRFSPILKIFNSFSGNELLKNIQHSEDISEFARNLLFSNFNIEFLKISIVYLIAMMFWAITFYFLYLKVVKNKQVVFKL